MVVNKQLQKQIFVEIIALSVLVIAIVYGMFAIGNNSNKVLSEEGMVLVLDDSSFKSINSSSDGVGIESEGIKYTVTNNNLDEVSYKLIIKVNEKKELLKYIRVSTDDLYVENLLDLEKYEDGYVLATGDLMSGYTRIHLIKMWYKLDVDMKIADDVIDYEFKLVKE